VFMRQEQQNVDSGEWLGTTRVQSVELNVADVQALLQQP